MQNMDGILFKCTTSIDEHHLKIKKTCFKVFNCTSCCILPYNFHLTIH